MSATTRDQAIAQCASVADMVAALECDFDRLQELRDARDERADETGKHVSEWAKHYPEDAAELAELETEAGECYSEEEARERILEDALSVEVSSGWHSPGEESARTWSLSAISIDTTNPPASGAFTVTGAIRGNCLILTMTPHSHTAVNSTLGNSHG